MWKEGEAGDNRPPRTRSGAQSPGDGETDAVGPGPWEREAPGWLCCPGQRAFPLTLPPWDSLGGGTWGCPGLAWRRHSK